MRKALTILMVVMMMAAAAAQAQQMKAITFNIRNNSTQAQSEDGRNVWYNRRASVVKMIESEAPDIMGLQEALLDQLGYIDRQFLKQYRRVGVGRDNGLTRGEHTAIYFNTKTLELVQQKTRWLSESPQRVSRGWDAACLRIVTIAHFKHRESGKDIYYFNTHLDHVGKESRSKSVRLIAKLIKEMVPAGAAVIVGGDMNTEQQDAIFEPLLDMGLEVARYVAPRTDYRNSYNAFGKERGKMIDHFFVRDVEMLRLHTILRGYGSTYLSDHYPVEIIFNL